MNNFRLGKVNNKFVSSKSYKDLRKVIITTLILSMLVYIFKDNLYKINNRYIILFAETAPNLIASFHFTLIGMFYILPFLKDIDPISKPAFVWLINVLNIIIFSLIEYGHVVLNLGSWDNNDIVASLIGLMFSTAIYFKLRNDFLRI